VLLRSLSRALALSRRAGAERGGIARLGCGVDLLFGARDPILGVKDVPVLVLGLRVPEIRDEAAVGA
jgi:hypothetical protein